MTRRSRLAVVAGALGVIGIFDMLLGPILIHVGAVAPLFGFQWLFGLGLLEAIAGLLLGMFAVHLTRPETGLAGRGFAWAGVACGAAGVVILAVALRPGVGLPAINDITTDPADPPVFSARDRDMSYPGDDFAAQQRAAYPDLAPIRVSSSAAQALELARETAVALGWEIVAVEPATGHLEARVRPLEAGAVIDVRSKSRDGRGDLGANARRIRAFAAAIPR
jgi:hypothetical protein